MDNSYPIIIDDPFFSYLSLDPSPGSSPEAQRHTVPLLRLFSEGHSAFTIERSQQEQRMRDLTIYIYWIYWIYRIYRIMNQTSSKCDSGMESLPSCHQLPESHHAVCRRLEAHASAGCGTASKPRFSPPIVRIFHHKSALDICLSSVKTCQNMSK